MPIKTSKLVQYLGELYPYQLAEDYDNVGLIWGDPGSPIQRVLMAVDLTLDVAKEAAEKNCQAVITHHPPIFRAIKKIDLSTTQGAIIGYCLQNNIASIALHTNLDSARGGLNDTVGELLGLTSMKPLMDSGKERLYKLAVFVPETHADRVREAMFEAGAGAIGNYDQCSFNTPGTGTFRGGENANPAIGQAGQLERVNELKIEVLLQRERFGRVYGAILAAHPYEEVAYDLYPLENRERETGLGRIGTLPKPVALREFCDMVTGLGVMVLRHVGSPDAPVRKVALCTGAGGDFTMNAASAGADVYLTAEVKHHHALDAAERGLCVVETEHGTLERAVWPRLVKLVEKQFEGQLTAIVSGRERNCWIRYP